MLMLARTRFAALLLGLFCLSALTSSANAFQVEECENVCLAVNTSVPSDNGPWPPGVLVAFTDLTNGTGEDSCATCTRCKLKVQVSFSSPPASSGEETCFSYVNYGSPTTWTTPGMFYSRSGVLRQNCQVPPLPRIDFTSFFAFDVHDCDEDPGPSSSYVLQLSCPCEAQ